MLKADAYWDYSHYQVGRDDEKFEKELLVVSHCWESMEHADPSGSQLRRLAQFLRETKHPNGRLLQDCIHGVFLDMCSLYQFPREKDHPMARASLPPTQWVDFSSFPTFPPKILGGFPRKTTLRELLGTMGLEPTDCRGTTLSISHK